MIYDEFCTILMKSFSAVLYSFERKEGKPGMKKAMRREFSMNMCRGPGGHRAVQHRPMYVSQKQD
jgi:hypothetical protein